nr:hypothetical protein [Tanacetum cinerariifolium]
MVTRKNTSTGARNTGIGQGNKQKADSQDPLRRNYPAGSIMAEGGVTHDAVMLRVFPITLTGATKRHYPLSKTTKQLEEIRNFKQDGDETLYQAWEKWHDSSSSKNIDSSSNTEGVVAIVSELDSLGRDMKKLKENVHTIQVGCQTYGGAHLDKECPLNKEVTSIEELTKEFHAKAANEAPDSMVDQCKAVYANDEVAINNTSSKETNELHKVSFISNDDINMAHEENDVPSRVLPC